MTKLIRFTRLSDETIATGFDNPNDPTVRVYASKWGVGFDYYDAEIDREVGVILSPNQAEGLIEEIRRMLKVSKEKYQ